MNTYDMFVLLGWGLLLGGIPTAGYYLYQYGRALMERRRNLPFDPFTRQERAALWKQEIDFRFFCTALALFGLMLCNWLAKS
ncbi:hypothetical protein [Hymenobacter guriensis]|uniref:Uncharacterized protein n=1 Tax=Hymenobacter guriensis TaxID=2793065 RepID=A0ABS0L838_9BACT|nr:hypothetical protein [Hymenobacter guriensis]MBG8556323.1 hypothetical protein [Hymenobacter guriensis]